MRRHLTQPFDAAVLHLDIRIETFGYGMTDNGLAFLVQQRDKLLLLGDEVVDLAGLVIEEGGDVSGLECVRIEWEGREMKEVAGSEFILPADLILLAMGFTGPLKRGLLDRAGVELCERGNVKADERRYATSEPNVYACGDMRRGQSLVVWAIREGRQAARAVDEALMGVTELPR